MKTLICIHFACLFVFSSCDILQNRYPQNTARISYDVSFENDQHNLYRCEKIIEQYNHWMNDYEKFLRGYYNDPLNPYLSSTYIKKRQEFVLWQQKCKNQLLECKSNPLYLYKYQEITLRAKRF
ncbi:MAG: hypothetical protein MI922_03100 [Bacteroidales bacterium]|nr:hypothetical protein [Bacteroidales bacterium]